MSSGASLFDVRRLLRGRGAEAPASEVVAVEERRESFLGLERVGLIFDEARRSQQRPQCGAPLGVACFVRMEKIGEFLFLGFALGVGEERVGIEERDLFVAASDVGQQLVEFANLFGGAIFLRRSGHYLAEDDRHFRIVCSELRQEQPDVLRDPGRRNLQVDIVRADEQDDAAGIERENVFINAGKQAATGVAADAAVGDIQAGEVASKIVVPTLRNRIAEEDEGVVLVRFEFGEVGAAIGKAFLKLRIDGANGANAGDVGVVRGSGLGGGFFSDRGLGDGVMRCGELKRESE